MLKKFFENVKNPKNNFGGRFMVKGMNVGHEKSVKWGRSFLHIKTSDAALDLGCGGEHNVQYFLTKAKKVYGMDYSKASADIASSVNNEAIRDDKCKIIEADVVKLPFKNESIDVVTAFETIYFWKNIEVSFREIHRVLIKDGQFLICSEGAYREHKDIKKWADMLDSEVYSPEYLTEALNRIGSKCEYHLGEEDHLVSLARKL